MKPDEVVRAFLTETARGAPEEIHSLPGRPLARLCLLRNGGLYLELKAQRVQRCLTITDETSLRCRLGTWRSEIQLPHRRFVLHGSKASQVLRALGLSRLRARISARLPRTCGDGPFWQTPGALLEVLLAERLSAGEQSLACLRTGTELSGNSHWTGPFTAPAWLWVTDRRLELVAAGPTGDLACEPVTAAELRVDSKGRVATPRRSWVQPAEPLRQLLATFALNGSARALEVVRLGHRLARSADAKAAPRVVDWAASILEPLTHDEATEAVASLLFSALRHPQLDGLPPAEASEHLPHRCWQVDLLALHASWRLPPGAGWVWLARLPDASPEQAPRALRLARYCWQLAREQATDTAGRVRADTRLAQALLRLGEKKQALDHIERARSDLPPLELGDIELGAGSSPGAALRRRLSELRVAAVPNPSTRCEALVEFWTLDPLHLALLERIANAAPARLAQRAGRALATLTQAAAGPQARTLRVAGGLPEPLLHAHLQHPFARQQAPLNARLQQLLAAEDQPDLENLRLYCQRITRSDSLVTRTVDEFATLFGIGHVECYVSRGFEDVGVRAYPDKPPFLLFGGQHLEPDSRHYLPESEMAFIIGAELLHLRLKQRRVSTRDVYRGAIDKGRRSVDIALSLIPVISTLHLGKRLTMVTAKLSLPQLRRAIHAAKGVSEVVERSASSRSPRLDIAPAAEELIAFQWLQQLNADRAGLLCAQDPAAAVRALLRSRVELARASETFEQRGALAAIERHRESHPAAFDDLRARLGLMLCFYLSDEFETLTDASFTTNPPNEGPSNLKRDSELGDL